MGRLLRAWLFGEATLVTKDSRGILDCRAQGRAKVISVSKSLTVSLRPACRGVGHNVRPQIPPSSSLAIDCKVRTNQSQKQNRQMIVACFAVDCHLQTSEARVCFAEVR